MSLAITNFCKLFLSSIRCAIASPQYGAAEGDECAGLSRVAIRCMSCRRSSIRCWRPTHSNMWEKLPTAPVLHTLQWNLVMSVSGLSLPDTLGSSDAVPVRMRRRKVVPRLKEAVSLEWVESLSHWAMPPEDEDWLKQNWGPFIAAVDGRRFPEHPRIHGLRVVDASTSLRGW